MMVVVAAAALAVACVSAAEAGSAPIPQLPAHLAEYRSWQGGDARLVSPSLHRAQVAVRWTEAVAELELVFK
jgi:hypothetical protein